MLGAVHLSPDDLQLWTGAELGIEVNHSNDTPATDLPKLCDENNAPETKIIYVSS